MHELTALYDGAFSAGLKTGGGFSMRAHLPYQTSRPARMETMQSIKVAILDDQLLIRSGLSMPVNSRDDLTVTGEASNGQDAVNSVHIRGADVVLIMDVCTPVMDRIDASKSPTGT